MQFIPGTWSSAGVDSDNDGTKNPQDIDDAATATGVYLCAGSDDLSTQPGARAATHRYNHSSSYVDLVMKISAAYAAGDFSQSPDGYPSSSVITSTSNDQTLTPKQRTTAKKKQGTTEEKGNGGSSRPGAPKPEPTAETPTPFQTETYAREIEALYIETNGRPIRESCDAGLTTWQCHYDGIRAFRESRLDILLTHPRTSPFSRPKTCARRRALRGPRSSAVSSPSWTPSSRSSTARKRERPTEPMCPCSIRSASFSSQDTCPYRASAPPPGPLSRPSSGLVTWRGSAAAARRTPNRRSPCTCATAG